MRILETKQIRLTMGLSQTEFADALGVSRIAVTKWESNKSIPSPATIKKLIKFCKDNEITIER